MSDLMKAQKARELTALSHAVETAFEQQGHGPEAVERFADLLHLYLDLQRAVNSEYAKLLEEIAD